MDHFKIEEVTQQLKNAYNFWVDVIADTLKMYKSK
jgi:hypothetical protein